MKMKILFPLLWLSVLINTSVFCQTKTFTVKEKTVILYDTTWTVTIHDTIKVPCDTGIVSNPTDTTVQTIYRGLYINSFDKILNSATLQDALISDLNRWKITGIHLYGLSNIGVSAYKKEAEFISRIKTQTSVTDVTATGGSGNTFTGARTSYNAGQNDLGDYSGWNLEYESWNASNVSTAWQNNLTYLSQMQQGKQAGQVKWSIQYFGWWTKTPMKEQAAPAIVQYTDYGLIHDYRSAPDFNYMKSRMNDLNTAAKNAGKVFNVRVIFSAEPDFMQNYYKTHSIDQAYDVIKAAFDQEKYSNLSMDGYVIFHLDFLRVSQPTPMPYSMPLMKQVMPRANNLPEFAAPGFVNETTLDHLMMENQQ